ncbi:MAG TPA: hypothetical protein DCL40_03515, partial [Coxiellaceae bacterium]|nr:hypothetical protein [Coxiellaceae bacterium]
MTVILTARNTGLVKFFEKDGLLLKECTHYGLVIFIEISIISILRMAHAIHPVGSLAQSVE